MMRKTHRILTSGGFLRKRKIFVFWAVFLFLFGVVFIFLVPPFQKPDENAHFLRAAALREGFLSCREGEKISSFLVPEKYILFAEELETSKIAFNYEEKFQLDRMKGLDERIQDKSDLVMWGGKYCSLPFWGYVPFLAPLILGEAFGSMVLSFYLARLLAFCIFVACVVYSYSLVKNSRLKFIVLAYSLFPMVLHQATAVGYDYLQLSLAPVLFSLVMRMYGQRRVRIKTVVTFAILVAIFSTVKPGYYFIALMFFLIPYKKITSSRYKYLLILLGYLSLSFLPAILVTLFFKEVGLFAVSSEINPSLQLRSLLDFEFLFHLMRNTLRTYLDFYIRGFWGRFGWLDYDFSAYLYPLISISSLFLAFYIQKGKVFKNYRRIGIVTLATILATVGFLFLTVYLTWNPVGNIRISGIQGRYFLVLVPTIFLFVASVIRAFIENRRFRYIFLCAILSVILGDLVLVVLNRYYGMFPKFFNL